MMYQRHKSKAFTLVELLVSITVVIILASIVLYGMSGMQDLAKIQRTKSQLAKIHELLAEHWEGYEVRRVTVAIDDPTGIWRLTALRELMRYELPDRQSDIESDVLGLASNPLTTPPPIGQPVPALVRTYYNFIQNHANAPNWGALHQGAECLYMIIAQMEVDDMSALEMFSDSDIGDVDNDGMPEILDGWGNPIRFLRWPAAFPSPLHPMDTDPGTPGIQPQDSDLSTPDVQVASDFQDPFDLANAHWQYNMDNGTALPPTFRIVPLVVSAGPDGEFGIGFDRVGGSFTWFREASSMPGLTYDATTPVNNPFDDLGGTGPLGDVSDANTAVDNITNHSLQTSIR